MKRIQGALRNRAPCILCVDICSETHSYADFHDVDEELRAILSQGGRCGMGHDAGVVLRCADSYTSLISEYVASSNILKLIIYYTDWFDVDEDLGTISLQGGCWDYGNYEGVTRRGMDINATTTFDYVASSTVEISIYTDSHDVDEDLRSIAHYGGAWAMGNAVGIACRYMTDSSSIISYTVVAFMCRHPKLIKYYTDYHDVDEEMKTIMTQGGGAGGSVVEGVARRNLNDSPTASGDYVASSNMQNM